MLKASFVDDNNNGLRLQDYKVDDLKKARFSFRRYDGRPLAERLSLRTMLRRLFGHL